MIRPSLQKIIEAILLSLILLLLISIFLKLITLKTPKNLEYKEIKEEKNLPISLNKLILVDSTTFLQEAETLYLKFPVKLVNSHTEKQEIKFIFEGEEKELKQLWGRWINLFSSWKLINFELEEKRLLLTFSLNRSIEEPIIQNFPSWEQNWFKFNKVNWEISQLWFLDTFTEGKKTFAILRFPDGNIKAAKVGEKIANCKISQLTNQTITCTNQKKLFREIQN